MSKWAFVLVFLLAIWGSSAWAGTIVYVSGDVFGQWSADTVVVTDSIRVPADSTLIIDPGTTVLFLSYDKFVVSTGATLLALGTETDTILFDEYYPGNRWHGIRFFYASASCRLEYCHLKHGWASGDGDDYNGGAIYCNNSSITIRHCLIDSCSAANAGGAIFYRNNSDLTIDSTVIRANRAETYEGGGICSRNSTSKVAYSTISDNFAWESGGGICCSQSTITIANNNITNNANGLNGSGLYVRDNSDAEITSNIISQNHSDWTGSWEMKGKGISVGNSNVFIHGNTITDNFSPGSWHNYGGGIHTDNSSGEISDNIISGNSASGDQGHGGGIYCENTHAPTIIDNMIRDNWAVSDGGGIGLLNSNPDSISGNFIISNATGWYGGGIHSESSNPLITRNVVDSNYAGQNAGGIGCSYSNSQVIHNVVTNNTAGTYNGGGINCYMASAAIRYNTIQFNSAVEKGGGIHCNQNTGPIIANVISDNDAGLQGGGISLESCDPTIMNNTVSYNVSNQDGGGIHCLTSNPVIVNSIVYFNNATNGSDLYLTGSSSPDISYSCIGGYPPVAGNIDTAPLFRDADNGDFRLKATTCGYAENSPCIDAGDPDIFDDTLDCAWGLETSRSDMGAYGGINQYPRILDIPDQEINRGDEFTSVILDSYVSDPNNRDDELIWSVIGTDSVIISITERIASITVIDTMWIGADSVSFIATDPGGLSDTDAVIFSVHSPVAVTDEVSDNLPRGFRLYQNSPNPFNPATRIEYSMDKAGHVTLWISNILGQTVSVLVDSYESAGEKTAIWGGTDSEGHEVAAGIYFYHLKVGQYLESKKMLLLK